MIKERMGKNHCTDPHMGLKPKGQQWTDGSPEACTCPEFDMKIIQNQCVSTIPVAQSLRISTLHKQYGTSQAVGTTCSLDYPLRPGAWPQGLWDSSPVCVSPEATGGQLPCQLLAWGKG